MKPELIIEILPSQVSVFLNKKGRSGFFFFSQFCYLFFPQLEFPTEVFLI